MVDLSKFQKAIEEAAEQNDFTEAQAGFEFKALPEGPCRLRFVGYIETGRHEKEFKGEKKEKEYARFIFEVSGPKIEAREDGSPNYLSFEIIKSLSDRATFYKLFRRMNGSGTAKIFAELLGKAYRGVIRHNVVGEGSNARTYVNLTDADGVYTIAEPYYDDPETGERKLLAVDDVKGPIRCFLWDYADKDQWDSIFIDGEYEARPAEDGKAALPARSKNIYQERIKSALNWIGSPMQELLLGDLDIGEAQKPDRSDEAADGAAGDPLNNIT